MHLLRHLHARGSWLRRRLTPLLGDDRGDSPVPSGIIMFGLAAMAVALLVFLGSYVSGFIGEAPTSLPDFDFGGGGGD
jgi:hypothetical protein